MTAIIVRPAASASSVRTTILLSALLLGLFDLRVLSTHAWNPHTFILERDPARSLETGWGIGYDGQWYYEIARDPLGAAGRLDQPAYRYQRIVFPLLVFGLSLGRPESAAWAMIALNLIAAVAGCGFLAALLQRRRVSPLFALMLPLSLGYLFSLRVNLLEPLALAFGLAGYYLNERGRLSWSLALFSLAGLTKEIGLVFPMALILWALANRRWKHAGYFASAAFGPFLIWYAFVSGWLGQTSKSLAQTRPTLIPFLGLGAVTDTVSLLVIALWVVAPTLLFGALALRQIWRRSAGADSKDAYLVLMQGVLIATLPQLTWVDPLAVLRVGSGLLAASLIWMAAEYPRGLPFAAALWVPSGLILALAPGMI